MKRTKHNLAKIEDLLQSLGYRIRYEKGSFAPGACRLEANHVIVVNRFYDTAARMDSIAEILDQLSIDESNLNDEELKFLQKVLTMDQTSS